jgi:hypothetical protein
MKGMQGIGIYPLHAVHPCLMIFLCELRGVCGKKFSYRHKIRRPTTSKASIGVLAARLLG